MSASLVGSEMCIRDRGKGGAFPQKARPVGARCAFGCVWGTVAPRKGVGCGSGAQPPREGPPSKNQRAGASGEWGLVSDTRATARHGVGHAQRRSPSKVFRGQAFPGWPRAQGARDLIIALLCVCGSLLLSHGFRAS
eukprot:4826080-Alexandrium_andersonii.AAC.2